MAVVGGTRELLAWYRPRRRDYPWRVPPVDPYRVLVSEVMLQQTQAARVAPAFVAFLAVFPSVEALAAAPRSSVLRAWSGLGYNRRAVRLSEAARAVVREHAGVIPSDTRALASLPGVGPYTAAAVASFAYGVPVAALDINVRRVVARTVLGSEPHRVAPREVAAAGGAALDRTRPGEWNQALMDLGREVCRPVPRCGVCPLAKVCLFLRLGRQPERGSRRQGPFAGSAREARGRIVRELGAGGRSLGSLAARCELPMDRVAEACRALAADGLLAVSPAALAGRAGGRVRLRD